jgi:hypothetical protein
MYHKDTGELSNFSCDKYKCDLKLVRTRICVPSNIIILLLEYEPSICKCNRLTFELGT